MKKHASLFFDLSHDALATLNLEGELLDHNVRWTSLLGWESSDLVGKPLKDRVHPDDRLVLDLELRRLSHILMETPSQFEVRFNTSSGGYRWFNVHVLSKPNEDLFLLNARDITELKRDSLPLEQTQRAMKFGTWELNSIDNRLIWTLGTYELFGVAPKDFDPSIERMIEFIHTEDRDRFTEKINQLLSSGEPFTEVVKVNDRWDRSMIFKAMGSAVFKEGAVLRVFGAFENITDTVRAEEELRASEERFARIAANLPGVLMVVVLRAEREISLSYVSPPSREVLEVEPQYLISGQVKLVELIHPDDRLAFLDKLNTGGAFKTEVRWEGRVVLRSGKLKWVQLQLRPRRESVQDLNWDGILTDITRQKASELQLAQSYKLASLGSMAGGIAHEINNPLAVIQGKSEQMKKALLNGTFETKNGLHAVERILATCDRMAKIVRSLNLLSRNSDQESMEFTHVKQILDDVLELAGERMKSNGIEFRVSVPEQAMIECRAVQISQVILNLINNAIDALAEQENPWIEVTVFEQDDKMILWVTDSGHGILPEVAKKLMSPGFTTKPIGKGTGLGLNIAKKICQDHGGGLYLENNCPNTRFIATLKKKHSKPKEEKAA